MIGQALSPTLGFPFRVAAPPPAPAGVVRMDRGRFRQELVIQRAYCEGRSPFYAAVLRELDEDARQAPPWTYALEAAWKERRFAVGWEAVHLLLACLHHAAITSEASPLAAIYPSCGGSGVPDGEVRSFLRRAPPTFWERVRGSFVQTNDVGRSVAWMVAAAATFAPRGLPFHLVELGASAGLNTIGDHLPQACEFLAPDGTGTEGPAGWNQGPQDILSRTGLDQRPRRVADPADRRWLRACVWADDQPRLHRLDQAVEAYLHLEKQTDGPRLERCAFSQSPKWLMRDRTPRAGEGLLVFNALSTVYLSKPEYATLRENMVEALAPWGERAIWVEYERTRGTVAGPLELTIHRVADGTLQSRVVATGEPRPQRLQLRARCLFS